MPNCKTLSLSFLLPMMAVAVISFAYSKAGGNQLCNHTYALCTSALCIPEPGDPTKAICFCDVEEGNNMSTVPCKSLKPSTDGNGIQTIYSTFSLEQFMAGKKGM